MAITNYERVGKAMELLKAGLGPFVERELKSVLGGRAQAQAAQLAGNDPILAGKPVAQWDVLALLKLIWDGWNDIFRRTLGNAERSLVSELRDQRNRWAHQDSFSTDDAYRVLDSVSRLLTAVSAPQADEVEKMKMELLRVRFDEQVRGEKRKSGGMLIESTVTGALNPWRDIINPHHDVAGGGYQQAEFAADLWQVHLGEGVPEYREPVEFFRRTYLTESLKGLLVNAVHRLSGKGGDPVIQLQTNFGGGKTHSMLALYHLFSGSTPSEMAGVDALLAESKTAQLPSTRRVVLVGNKISPGNPVTKSDGTVVRTLWGELAYQLGGKKGYARVRADDEKATSPGDTLRELFNQYGPCLILIDEWVAYARMLHDQGDLPAGSFETQFTFAQTLTEAAKAAKNCLLVISLPASDTSGSPHAQADDSEVGGQRGREALDRLRNVVGRVEASWRPATAEEGFEIVRRRLFEPLAGPEQYKDRDVVARSFADLYRSQHAEFPPECQEADYEKRIKAAYPIHPEVFDRLYNDWSTLLKFQRTRGVLRLMAAVIHSLWERGDRSPLIMPATIPIDDTRVRSEITRYLSDNWAPIIEKDVDGPGSLPLQIDGDVANLGKVSACRRVARTIYLGSAPTAAVANRGLEDRRVKLGCVMPGETPGIFGDALRRLAAAATYLYQDGNRYWYATQPTVTKLADDRATQLLRESDKVVQEIERRLRLDLRNPGEFCRIHALPTSGADVPDDLDTRLVVLGPATPYSKEPGNAALKYAQFILQARGLAPRIYQNTIVFLAADKTRLQDLDEAVRKYLAWDSILNEKERERLDLSPHQVKQAETQRAAWDGAVSARLPETYQWLLAPVQESPKAAVTWQFIPLRGQDALAARASKKLKADQVLLTSYAATLLRMELDRVPLWRGDSVTIRQLIEDFGRYLYLPRLREPGVLCQAISTGIGLMTWEQDSFAYAESYDEQSGRYRGLRSVCSAYIGDTDSGMLVNPVVARKQLDAEAKAAPVKPAGSDAGGLTPPKPGQTGGQIPPTSPGVPKPRRYHGTVRLDPQRVGRDASRIADEVITHLGGLIGASIQVTLEIDANVPSGVPDNVVRTVTENARTLKFTNQGFETE